LTGGKRNLSGSSGWKKRGNGKKKGYMKGRDISKGGTRPSKERVLKKKGDP